MLRGKPGAQQDEQQSLECCCDTFCVCQGSTEGIWASPPGRREQQQGQDLGWQPWKCLLWWHCKEEGMCPLRDQHGSSHRNKREDRNQSCPDLSRQSSLQVQNKAILSTDICQKPFKKQSLASGMFKCHFCFLTRADSILSQELCFRLQGIFPSFHALIEKIY